MPQHFDECKVFVEIFVRRSNLTFLSSFHKTKDDKDKAKLSLKGLKAQKMSKPQEKSGRLKIKTTTLC